MYDYKYKMSDYINIHKITSLIVPQVVFIHWLIIMRETNFSRLITLKRIFLGGESINCKKLKPLVKSINFKSEIINTYGPTECTD